MEPDSDLPQHGDSLNGLIVIKLRRFQSSPRLYSDWSSAFAELCWKHLLMSERHDWRRWQGRLQMNAIKGLSVSNHVSHNRHVISTDRLMKRCLKEDGRCGLYHITKSHGMCREVCFFFSSQHCCYNCFHFICLDFFIYIFGVDVLQIPFFLSDTARCFNFLNNFARVNALTGWRFFIHSLIDGGSPRALQTLISHDSTGWNLLRIWCSVSPELIRFVTARLLISTHFHGPVKFVSPRLKGQSFPCGSIRRIIVLLETSQLFKYQKSVHASTSFVLFISIISVFFSL